MKTWIPVIVAVFAVVAIACGAAISSPPVESVSDGSETPGAPPPALSPATQGHTAVQPAPETASGGLDEACVQRVLGRAATGFTDVSAAERDSIFQQCSGDEEEQLARQLTGGRGDDFLDAIDVACLAGITGSEEFNLGDLTLEDRQRVFTECVPEDFARGQGGSGRPGGAFGGRLGGAFTDIGNLLEGCVTEALGETPENFFGLEPEQLEAIAEACGGQLPEGFGDFPAFGADGTGGFGGLRGQGGPGGVGGGLFRGGPAGRPLADVVPFDFSASCVGEVLGHPVEGPDDLTPDDFRMILANCG